MSKKETTKEENISVCDIMKTNTSEIIKKLEFQIPLSVQQYSDLYTRYLHTIDDLYGTCYIAEKEFVDKLNINQGVLKEFQEYSNALTNICLQQIEISAKYAESYIKMRKSALDTYDNIMHTMMDSYAKALSQFTKSIS